MDDRSVYNPESCCVLGKSKSLRTRTGTGGASRLQESRCDSPGANWVAVLVGREGTSPISPRQLAKGGVAEAGVLTTRSGGWPVWRPEVLDQHLKLIQEGGDVSPIHYPGVHIAIQRAFEVVKIDKMKNVSIFGSISSWVESILYNNGAKVPIVTVDYNQPKSFDERQKTELTTILKNEQLFDVAVS